MPRLVCKSARGYCVSELCASSTAQVSKLGNLWEISVAVNDGGQSESTDGPTSGWRQRSVVVDVVVVVAVLLAVVAVVVIVIVVVAL